MKSKKSGGKVHGSGMDNGSSAIQDHGFHNHQFEQRNASSSAHHGIVGVNTKGVGSASMVVKNAGGS
jgi:hypothetical protein